MAALLGQSTSDVEARFTRAVELQRQGLLEQAAAEYEALLKVDPNRAEAHANLGAVLMHLDRYEQAVQSYQSALRLNPALTPVVLNLGIAHYRKGEYEKAAEQFQRFLTSAPDHLQARQLLGLCFVELGRDREAIEALGFLLSQPSPDPAALYGFGLAKLRLQESGVNEIVERLAASSKGLPASHLLKGQSLLAQFEFEKAVAELQKAVELNANLPRLQYSLGLALFKLGRREEALDRFQQELRRSPKDFSTLYYVAHLFEQAGDLKEARRHLQMALSIEPDSPEANALLGKMLMKEGKLSDAIPPLESAVDHDPEDSEKRYLLARAYLQSGRREEAARQLTEVKRLKAQQLEKDRRQLIKDVLKPR